MKILWCFLIALFLCSCRTFDAHLVDSYDTYKKRSYVYLDLNNVNISNKTSAVINFDFYASIDSEKDTAYYIRLAYYNYDWIFIDKTNPATLIIDSQFVYVPSSISNDENVRYDGSVYEILTIPIEKDFIKQLANAKNIKMRLHGKYYYDTVWEKRNIDAIKSFCARLKI